MSSPKPKILSLQAIRELRQSEEKEHAYRAKILAMGKLELLEEMIRYQEERSNKGELDLDMMTRGKHLFKALEEKAETSEMRLLARSYRRHLELELNEHLKPKPARLASAVSGADMAVLRAHLKMEPKKS